MGSNGRESQQPGKVENFAHQRIRQLHLLQSWTVVLRQLRIEVIVFTRRRTNILEILVGSEGQQSCEMHAVLTFGRRDLEDQMSDLQCSQR